MSSGRTIRISQDTWEGMNRYLKEANPNNVISLTPDQVITLMLGDAMTFRIMQKTKAPKESPAIARDTEKDKR